MVNLFGAARVLWAKSDREFKDGRWHPLVHHLLDVAASAEAILELEPARTRTLYALDLDLPWEKALGWLLSLIALHDLGKACPAFQRKWPGGAERVRCNGLIIRDRIKSPNHAYVSQLILEDLLVKVGWHRRAALLAADAVGAHHGFRAQGVDLQEINEPELGQKYGDGDWDGVRNKLSSAILEVFGADITCPPPIQSLSAGAFMRIAGLTSFADWIGSNSSFFTFRSNVSDLVRYYQERLTIARKALCELGWEPRLPLQAKEQTIEEVFSYLGGTKGVFTPRALQKLVAEMVDRVSEPALVLIEAPMGEGKTEAAFYAHLRLQQQLGHRGMYMALPTQATGNAMFSRTSDFLSCQGRSEPVDLQLLHGAALLNTDFEKLLRVREIEDTQSGGVVRAKEWFTHKKRALLSEYGVGTVDQALLTVLNVKHQFVRLWGLGNRTVVIDEVHAYDAYTSTLLESLLSWLRALDSSVILMSATLPRALRERLLSAYGAEVVPEAEYPRVYRVSGGMVEVRHVRTDVSRSHIVIVREATSGVHELAQLLADIVCPGGCAVAIVNTVQRAQDLYCALRGTIDAELLLFHARYPAEERKAREEEVLQKFGKDGDRPQRAILVTTQVVEQSLDLDFDVMLTDLAPIDLMLQRIGRLHRHQRENRYGHNEPVLYVAGLGSSSELPDLKTPHWDKIYDTYVLLRSWWAIKSHGLIHLPEEIDTLVEEVYSVTEPHDMPPNLVQALKVAKSDLDKHVREAQSKARNVIIGLPRDGSWKSVPELEKEDEDDPGRSSAFRAQTRLGEPTAVVIPIYQIDGVYRLHPDDKPIRLDVEPNSATARNLFLRSISLSLYRLKGIACQGQVLDWKAGSPKAWSKHPLLRNCYPLLLRGGGQSIEYPHIHLSTELGVFYTSDTK